MCDVTNYIARSDEKAVRPAFPDERFAWPVPIDSNPTHLHPAVLIARLCAPLNGRQEHENASRLTFSFLFFFSNRNASTSKSQWALEGLDLSVVCIQIMAAGASCTAPRVDWKAVQIFGVFPFE